MVFPHLFPHGHCPLDTEATRAVRETAIPLCAHRGSARYFRACDTARDVHRGGGCGVSTCIAGVRACPGRDDGRGYRLGGRAGYGFIEPDVEALLESVRIR